MFVAFTSTTATVLSQGAPAICVLRRLTRTEFTWLFVAHKVPTRRPVSALMMWTYRAVPAPTQVEFGLHPSTAFSLIVESANGTYWICRRIPPPTASQMISTFGSAVAIIVPSGDHATELGFPGWA